jgi:hypothetical protein
VAQMTADVHAPSSAGDDDRPPVGRECQGLLGIVWSSLFLRGLPRRQNERVD